MIFDDFRMFLSLFKPILELSGPFQESFSPPLSRQSSHMEGRASPSRVSPQLGPQAELNPPEVGACPSRGLHMCSMPL